MSNAVMPLSDYKDTCDKIREKTASTDNIKSGELADKVTEVYEKGKQDQITKFYKAQQEGGHRIGWNYAYYGGWTDDMYDPQYDFTVSQGVSMYDFTKITDTKRPITFSEYSAAASSNVFSSSQLKTIRKLTLYESLTYNNWFKNASKLENIVIGGVIGNSISFAQSTKLTKASIQSIVSHLSDTTSSKTLTLSKTAVNNAFTDGSTSEEWLNLVATKPNWTISLS